MEFHRIPLEFHWNPPNPPSSLLLYVFLSFADVYSCFSARRPRSLGGEVLSEFGLIGTADMSGALSPISRLARYLQLWLTFRSYLWLAFLSYLHVYIPQ